METYRLACHPDHPAQAVAEIEARITSLDGNWLQLRWRINGAAQLKVPRFAGRARADELWLTTCFELFVQPLDSTGYCEFNFSPSERWAAYNFAGYREGMADRPMPRDPSCTMRRGSGIAIFDAAIPRTALPALPWHYGLCAVIEEEGGRKSYWAIAHPPGKPDFHHPACFAAQLPAPQRP